jgi:tetratricopeptide (TPR) repeat protein
MTEPSPTHPSFSLENRRVGIVGKLGSMNRKEARDAIREKGGILVEKIDDSIQLLVIGADHLPFDEELEWTNNWIHEGDREQQIEVISEVQLCQLLGLTGPEWNLARLYTPAMLAELLQLPLATIRRWHRRGLIQPVHQVKKLPYFDFQEVASAKRIAQLVASGASQQAIESKLSRLASLYPDLQRPLSQLSIIVEGKSVLLRNDGGLVEPGGQMRLDFDSAEPPDNRDSISIAEFQSEPATADPAVSGIPRSGNLMCEISQIEISQFVTPEEFLELAVDLEDSFDFSGAIEVYRAMSLALGPTADTCFRIAELLYQQNDLAGARERYYMAIELDEGYVEARASLGCVLTELKQTELAYSAFLGALQHHPDYPDVHFHLARLLDDSDRSLEAQQHWRRFLELAPQSPWAAEARQRLEGTAVDR